MDENMHRKSVKNNNLKLHRSIIFYEEVNSATF